MIKLNDKTLAGAIQKDGLKPMYYVTGNDEFLIDACISRVVRTALGADTDGLLRFDAVKSEDDAIEQPFFTYSFGNEPRAILFEGCEPTTMNKVRTELFAGLLGDIPDSTTVIFKQFIDDGRFSVSKKAEAFIALCPQSVLVEVTAKKGYELEAYIANMIKKQGCTAGDAVSKRIAELCGDDLMLISGEVAKLAAYADYGEITVPQVDALCVRTAEAGVYDMIAKIERKDARGALQTLGDMLDDRTAPLMITAALNTAFINYYRARLAKENRLPQKSLFDLFDYKANDRKVAIAYERCTRFSVAQLERMIGLLYELDLKLKSSTVEDRTLIEQYIARLALAAGDVR